MKKLTIIAIFLTLGFIMTSCGAEEIDACVGAASDPITYSVDCDDCCKTNGYKRGTVSSNTVGGNTNRACKCSGDPD